MAPTTALLESQTSQIIQCLFRDENEKIVRRQASETEYETDGPEDENFDPVIIADKLRTIGDALNARADFQTALSNMIKATVKKELEEAFSNGVDAVVQAQAHTQAEVAPEMLLIKASVAFGLYIKKCCPELKRKAESAMTGYLNEHVGSWVAEQGGWINQELIKWLICDLNIQVLHGGCLQPLLTFVVSLHLEYQLKHEPM
ncbi:bcl-2-like protein 15 [Neosynchiropus ocellatus]